MLADIAISNVLFLDIETVPAVYRYADMADRLKELWGLKTRFTQDRDGLTAEEIYDKAGIYAEFGKVICISTAIVHGDGAQAELRVKSFYGDDESKLLTEFSAMVQKYFSGKNKYLCGHNIKEFDAPFMARRMVVNGLELPDALNTPGKKPWEVSHLDTMDLWKFGDYKHFTSLNLLTALFDIPTPKDDIGGADVARVYWEDKDLERIKIYCEKDTIAVAHVLHKFKNLPLIQDEKIRHV